MSDLYRLEYNEIWKCYHLADMGNEHCIEGTYGWETIASNLTIDESDIVECYISTSCPPEPTATMLMAAYSKYQKFKSALDECGYKIVTNQTK
jgi:hypothetical protein